MLLPEDSEPFSFRLQQISFLRGTLGAHRSCQRRSRFMSFCHSFAEVNVLAPREEELRPWNPLLQMSGWKEPKHFFRRFVVENFGGEINRPPFPPCRGLL